MYDGFGDLPCNAECAERTCPQNIFGRCHDNATCEKQEKENRGEGNLEQGGNVMSMTENNTHAEIIAQVRIHAQMNIDAEKDKRELGILSVEGAIANDFADELEAAHKREVEKLQREYDECVRDYNNAQRSRSFAESRLRELKKSIASIALKLREHADNNDDEAMDPDDIYAHEAKAVRNFADEIDMTLDCETSCSAGLRDIFNAAAMREALEMFCGYSVTVLNTGMFNRVHLEALLNKAKAALALPPRNCDRFATVDEARKAHEAICEEYDKCHHGCPLNNEEHYSAFECFEAWLFAPANEKGENDGRK